MPPNEKLKVDVLLKTSTDVKALRQTLKEVEKEIESLGKDANPAQVKALEELKRKLKEIESNAKSADKGLDKFNNGMKKATAQANLFVRGLSKIGRAFQIAFPFTIAFQAFRILETGVRAFFGEITSGIKKLDEFKLQILEVAGIMSVMTANLDPDAFRTFAKFAEGARERLEVLGATALATGEEIFAGFLELTERGIILQTEEDFKNLLNIVNAISLVAQGTGRPLQQIKQELRLLLEGQIRPGAELVLLIKAIDASLLDLIRDTEDMNERFQLISNFLKPFQQVQEGIEDTLRGQISKLRTIFDIIERNAAEAAFEKILDLLKLINESLFDTSTLELTEVGERFVAAFAQVFDAVIRLGELLVAAFNPTPARIFSQVTGSELGKTEDPIKNIAIGLEQAAKTAEIFFLILRASVQSISLITNAMLTSFLAGVELIVASFKQLGTFIDKISGGSLSKFNNFLAVTFASSETVRKIWEKITGFISEAVGFLAKFLDLDASDFKLTNTAFQDTKDNASALFDTIQEINKELKESQKSVDIVGVNFDRASAEAKLLIDTVRTGNLEFETLFEDFPGLVANLNEEFQKSKEILFATNNVDSNAFSSANETLIAIEKNFKNTETAQKSFGNSSKRVLGSTVGATSDLLNSYANVLRNTSLMTQLIEKYGVEAVANFIKVKNEADKLKITLAGLGNDIVASIQLQIEENDVEILANDTAITLAKELGVGGKGATLIKKSFTGLFKDAVESSAEKGVVEPAQRIAERVAATISESGALKNTIVETLASSEAFEKFTSSSKSNASAVNKQQAALEKLVKTIQKINIELAPESERPFLQFEEDLRQFNKTLADAKLDPAKQQEALRAFDGKFIASITKELAEQAKKITEISNATQIETSVINANLTAKKDTLKNLILIGKAEAEANRLRELGEKFLDPNKQQILNEFLDKRLNIIKEEADKQIILNREKEQAVALNKENNKFIEEAEKRFSEAANAMDAFILAQEAGLPTSKELVGNLGEMLEVLDNIDETIAKGSDPTDLINAFNKLGDAAIAELALDEGFRRFEDNLKIAQKLAEETAEAIREAFSDLIFKALQGDLEGIDDLFDSLVDTIQRALADAFAEKLVIALGIGQNRPTIGEAEIIRLNELRNQLLLKIAGASDEQINAIKSGTDAQIESTKELSSEFLGGVKEIFNSSGSVGSAGGLFGGIFGPLKSVFGSLGGAFGGLGDAFGGIFEGISSIVSQVASFLGPIGQAASAIFSLVKGLISFFKSLFEKPPRLDLDFDQLRDDRGKGTGIPALVGDFLTDTIDNIFNVSVDRKSGQNADEIVRELQQILVETIRGLQDTIFTLPKEIALSLNDALLSTPIDIFTKVGGDRFLEFDDSGNSIGKQLEAFKEGGELEARFAFSIRDFFKTGLDTLGVETEKANELVDGLFDDFLDIKGTGAKAREARAAIGGELIQLFEDAVTLFNIAEGNIGDSITQSINKLNQLALEFGDFDGNLPSLSQLSEIADEMLRTGNITPEATEALAEFRQELINTISSLTSSISSLISLIQSVNNAIVQLGGESINISGQITGTINELMAIFEGGGLGFGEQEQLLGDINSLIGQFIAEEERALQAQLDAQRDRINAQKEAIQNQIEGLQEQKTAIKEVFDARIDALEEELDLVKQIQDFAQGIRDNILDLLTGPESIDGIFQRLDTINNAIADLFLDFQSASGAEQLSIGKRLQELINQGLSIAGDGFANPSVEYRDEFRQTILRLEELEALIGPTRTIEEITAEIESLTQEMEQTLQSIDNQIEALRAQSDALNDSLNSQINISEQARQQALEYYQWVQEQALKILEERLLQLEEVGVDTNSALSASEQFMVEGLNKQDAIIGLLDEIVITLRGASSFAGGGFVQSSSPLLSFLHGPEFVVPERQMDRLVTSLIDTSFRVGMSNGRNPVRSSDGFISIGDIHIHGDVDSRERVKELGAEFEITLRKVFPRVMRDPKFKKDSGL